MAWVAVIPLKRLRGLSFVENDRLGAENGENMGPSSFETPWRAARGANEATEGGVSFSQTWAVIAQRAALMETAISRRRAATTSRER